MPKKHLALYFTIVGVALVCAGILFFLSEKEAIEKTPTPMPVEKTDTGKGIVSAEVRDDIRVVGPVPGSAISSPLVMTGFAKGPWYFEASFPVILKDSNGQIIAQGPATATGNWMTTDFVPFTASLTFASQPSGSVGTLILKKDNPSGEPQNDASISIPVQF